MRAAYVEELGDPDAIQVGQLPEPVPGPHQAVVHVEAVAVNPVDTLLRSGQFHTEVSFPLALGRDLVGTVTEVGDEVDGLAPGARVWTSSTGYGGRPGASAELVPVAYDRLYPLPEGADPTAFVAAIHPGTTAVGLLERTRLEPGETLVVVGANGAVGMCLVQVAHARGARVVAVVRNPKSAERLRELGADTVVTVADAESDLPSALPTGTPVDVFTDTTGRVDLGAAVEWLAPRGRVGVITGRRVAEVDVWRLYTGEVAVCGFIMSAMTASELADAAAWINARHADRPLTVGVGSVRDLDAAAEAHAAVESGDLPRLEDGTVGRIVLQP